MPAELTFLVPDGGETVRRCLYFPKILDRHDGYGYAAEHDGWRRILDVASFDGELLPTRSWNEYAGYGRWRESLRASRFPRRTGPPRSFAPSEPAVVVAIGAASAKPQPAKLFCANEPVPPRKYVPSRIALGHSYLLSCAFRHAPHVHRPKGEVPGCCSVLTTVMTPDDFCHRSIPPAQTVQLPDPISSHSISHSLLMSI